MNPIDAPGRPSLLDSWRIYRRARRTIGCNDCLVIPKHPLAGEIVPGDPPHQFMHNGLKVRLGGYHGAWMAEVIKMLKGHHEPQEERLFHEVLKTMAPGAVMLEAGSYWAYYSMWFRRRVPDARVYMIEPVAHKLTIGRENFVLNGLTGEFRNAFVGATSSPCADFVDWDGSVLRLPRIALDDFMKEEGIDFLDLLHADIQGAELDMLAGARGALADGRIGFLFISTHPGMHEPSLNALRAHGYRVVCEHSIEESCSGDGLIVARGPRTPVIAEVPISRAGNKGRVREDFGALVELLYRKECRRLWSAIRARR